MESLIREAFLHIEVIGPHVYEGHFDLVGRDGDVILPSVWEHAVVPGMSVTMHMWPLPEKTEGTESEDEDIKAAREAAAHSAPKRVRIDADDPRWIPPPTIVREGVFGFPDSASMADDTHSLYLALFEIRFDENIQTAQVTAFCDLSPTMDGEAADAEWKVGFFRRSSAGLVDGGVLDSTGFNRTRSQVTVLEIKDSQRYGAAIFLRSRRAEQEAPFSLIFDKAIHTTEATDMKRK
jgi:hypothetical protein